MNDRELLEYAAKAAEYNVRWVEAATKFNYEGFVFDRSKELKPPIEWNPLTDDGDALRLAVKLGLFLVRDDRPIGETESDFSKDPYAATRRAIVRAAAEFGKRMP